MRVFDWLDSESGSDRAHTVGGVPKHPLPHNHDKIYEIPVPSTSDPKWQYFSQCIPEEWDFPKFSAQFPSDTVKQNLLDYQNALRWILQHHIDINFVIKSTAVAKMEKC